mmetsp:Transcript_17623/g.35552  ORF Transcript_17623/g.35552 Transcript_17623/m.35552 type:complete len:218 (-) Transcript_17623:2-655(-)
MTLSKSHFRCFQVSLSALALLREFQKSACFFLSTSPLIWSLISRAATARVSFDVSYKKKSIRFRQRARILSSVCMSSYIFAIISFSLLSSGSNDSRNSRFSSLSNARRHIDFANKSPTVSNSRVSSSFSSSSFFSSSSDCFSSKVSETVFFKSLSRSAMSISFSLNSLHMLSDLRASKTWRGRFVNVLSKRAYRRTSPRKGCRSLRAADFNMPGRHR